MAIENARKKTYQGLSSMSVFERRWFVLFYPRGEGGWRLCLCKFTHKFMGNNYTTMATYIPAYHQNMHLTPKLSIYKSVHKS